jgi:hypothetical protein
VVLGGGAPVRQGLGRFLRPSPWNELRLAGPVPNETAGQRQTFERINKVGWILMIVGVVGAVLSIIVMVAANARRRSTVVDDGRGNVVRRVDSTY